MWTYNEAKPLALKLNARIVGSVRTKGHSVHDLDLKVDRYDSSLKKSLTDMAYEFVGSQMVSPQEIRRSGKFGRNATYWLRNRRFVNRESNKVVEIWTVET